MKRTKHKPKEFKLPDAINRSIEKHGYTSVSNSFIRNPKISTKAKMILILLLSNKEGWTSHVTTIAEMMKEGRDYIQSGLKELEQFGYLLRIRFRDERVLKGSFWAYTDIAYNFNYHKNLKILEKKGYKIVLKVSENIVQTGDTFVGTGNDVNNSTGKTVPKNTQKTLMRRKYSTNGNTTSSKSATNNTNIIKKTNLRRITSDTPGGVSSVIKKREKKEKDILPLEKSTPPLSRENLPKCVKGYTDETFPDDEGETCHTCQFKDRCTFFD